MTSANVVKLDTGLSTDDFRGAMRHLVGGVSVITAGRGEVMHIAVSDSTFVGNCRSGQITQEQADFVTSRIFPGPFAGKAYDAATCTTRDLTPSSAAADDAGAD